MKDFLAKVWAWVWGKVKTYRQFFYGFGTCLLLVIVIAIMKGV